MMRKLAILCASAAGLQAASVAADSSRGARLFETLACVQCHAINGTGGAIAPDLGRQVDRNFTPAALAATMWNHAPAMWTAMRQRGISPAGLDDQAAADLFAFFYSARFFEKPGDAARGKSLFHSDHCSQCHGWTQHNYPAARQITQPEAIGQPIALAAAMWNHGANMREAFARLNLQWPELTAQDLSDMLVYLRNLPQAQTAAAGIEISSGAGGEALFRSKGCAGCHKESAALTGRLKGKTLTDIAAAMWNHQPRMASAPPQLTAKEMRELASYLWAGQFFEDGGDAAAGRRVFAVKRCAACHENAARGAPTLGGKQFTGATMVSVLWRHGPQMLDRMKARNIPWPRFDEAQMSNLIAFLNAGR